MYRFFTCTLFLLYLFTIKAYSQKELLEDDFQNNRNEWKLRNDSNFLVTIIDGALHIEKKEKNFVSRGCLWYTRNIPGLNTQNDFSVTFWAKYISGGDIIDLIDFQWGQSGKVVNGKLSSNLYQLSFLLNKGEVKLDYFNRSWTYFVRKKVDPFFETAFNPEDLNKYELEQKDSFLVFRVNDKEVLKQFYHPIAGSNIGFQQCLKGAWEIDKMIIRQLADQKKNSLDSSFASFIPLVQTKPSSEKELYVFPNPFQRDLYISIPMEKEENVKVVLMDMGGAVWQQHNKRLPEGTQLMRMYADIPSGSYVVKVQVGSKVLSSKVVKL